MSSVTTQEIFVSGWIRDTISHITIPFVLLNLIMKYIQTIKLTFNPGDSVLLFNTAIKFQVNRQCIVIAESLTENVISCLFNIKILKLKKTMTIGFTTYERFNKFETIKQDKNSYTWNNNGDTSQVYLFGIPPGFDLDTRPSITFQWKEGNKILCEYKRSDGIFFHIAKINPDEDDNIPGMTFPMNEFGSKKYYFFIYLHDKDDVIILSKINFQYKK